MTSKVDFIDSCTECDSRNISKDHVRAEIICNACGLVIDESIVDLGPEWRAFNSEQSDKRSRTGAPMTYLIHDRGLSTIMGWENKDAHGGDIPTSSRAQLYRMRKWQNRLRVSNAKERNLVIALIELNKVSSRLSLPKNITEVAAVLYRRALDKKLIRGRSKEKVVAALIYAACRQCNVPRTLEEVSQAAAMDRKEVGRVYRYVARELGFSLNPTTPIDYVPRFRSELKLPFKVQKKAIEILESAMKAEMMSGKAPTGMAASAIYIASILLGVDVTQKGVSDVAGVTEVTIRNRYKELAEKLDIDIVV
ncbi:MAG: transcription initiation factor IIB [Candidatus Hydrothermarchaeales archaeon]